MLNYRLVLLFASFERREGTPGRLNPTGLRRYQSAMAGIIRPHYRGENGEFLRGNSMAEQWVRLGMAITIIALISLSLYQFSSRASAVEPQSHGIVWRP